MWVLGLSWVPRDEQIKERSCQDRGWSPLVGSGGSEQRARRKQVAASRRGRRCQGAQSLEAVGGRGGGGWTPAPPHGAVQGQRPQGPTGLGNEERGGQLSHHWYERTCSLSDPCPGCPCQWEAPGLRCRNSHHCSSAPGPPMHAPTRGGNRG